MRLLKCLTKSDLLNHLITTNIKYDLDTARTAGTFAGCCKLENVIRDGIEEGGVSVSHVDIDADFVEYAADAFPRGGESVKDHLVRNLETLLFPLDIRQIMYRFSKAPPSTTLNAIHVNDSPLSLVDISCADDVLEELRAALKAERVSVPPDSLRKVLGAAVGAAQRASLHAEAALMAHALSAHEHTGTALAGPEDIVDRVKGLLEDDRIAIGVSKRCCFCCNLLAELINKRPSGRLNRTQPKVDETFKLFQPDASTGKEVLEGGLISNLPEEREFEGHLQDVVDITQYFLTSPEGFDADIALMSFFAFVTYRCRYKLISRITNNIWVFPGRSQHPTAYIHEKLKDAPPAIPSGISISIPDSAHDSYPVTGNNAVAWAELLQVTVDSVKKLLERMNMPQATSAGEEIVAAHQDLHDNMRLLKHLIQCDLVGYLITDDVRREPGEARKANVIRDRGKDSKRTVPTGGVSGQDALPGEGVKEHLVRNLEAVVFPLDIQKIMKRFSKAPASTKLMAIHVDDGPLDPLDVSSCLTDVLEELQTVLKDADVDVPLDSLQKVLDEATWRARHASPHAETVLMAHALSVHENTESVLASASVLDPVKDVLKNDTIPIGVSENCCFCCDLLAQLIAERQTSGVRFILPSTHSTVFSWYPPEGLPVEILRAMKDRLLAAVRDTLVAAKESVEKAGSLRTSPSHSDSESSVDYPSSERRKKTLAAVKDVQRRHRQPV
ncbi:uncharacterized protein BXZ73DRAFT_101809 [Epithele typhae]|uniref:uncharacterized protein n=1 Tax=Epithele typhae TaxID=378194 RepID=UPI002008CA03|nr:uncharacterized protein BXZ73DRAFT_101809 [Epithele typhae]KAH9930435.1 hypothetical protein BXZ73DRAFT_101809 [Epithele typhae]